MRCVVDPGAVRAQRRQTRRCLAHGGRHVRSSAEALKQITDANHLPVRASAPVSTTVRAGKVNAGGNSCGRKDRIEQSGAHQFFDYEFPGGNVTGVM